MNIKLRLKRIIDRLPIQNIKIVTWILGRDQPPKPADNQQIICIEVVRTEHNKNQEIKPIKPENAI